MVCKKCGNKLGDNPKMMYCPQCGTAIDRSEAEKVKRKKGGKLRIVLAVLAGILLIGGGYVATHAKCKLVVKDGECYVREGLFQKKGEMTGTVDIPEGVTSIGRYAFFKCSSLSSISLPEGLTSIGNGAFFGCSSLSSISLPEGLTSIEDIAFDGCSSLSSISLPEGLTSIGNGAFNGCSSLSSISLPEGLTSIGDYVFDGCSSLSSISLPKGLTSIEYNTFSGCDNLKTIKMDESQKEQFGNIIYPKDCEIITN